MIITMCGSARFEPWFHAWNQALSLCGQVVFGLSTYPSFMGGEKDWYDDEQKTMLDRVHQMKIEASEAILVLNVFGYIGSSTLSEIGHATSLSKTIYYLESWGSGCGMGGQRPNAIKRAFGIGESYASPIDTFANSSRRGVWDLPLGEGGPKRSKLVSRINELHEAEVERALKRLTMINVTP